MTRVLSWPIDRLQRLLGFVYYEFLFDTGSSWSAMLAPRVQVWEQQRGKGDTPIPQTLWEEQYTSGHWNFLRSLDELGRFSVMIGYLHSLKPDGAVLDIGCGEGVLFERMQPAREQYLGIDISAEAVTRARSRSAGTFVCADAEQFVPTDAYDAILFNESLYYFVDPVSAVVRYATVLRPGGIMIVSTFLRSRRGRAILRALKRKFTVLDETSITHDTRTWTCSVLAHTPPPVSRP